MCLAACSGLLSIVRSSPETPNKISSAVNLTFNLILHMRKVRIRELKGLSQASLLESGRTDSLIQGYPAPKLLLLTIYMYE